MADRLIMSYYLRKDNNSESSTYNRWYAFVEELPYNATGKKLHAVLKEQAKKDLRAKARPELVSLPDSIDGYDTVVLAYPNYWGTMPMAVFTFLEHYDFSGKTILPVCTNEGSGMGGSERDIRRSCPGATVKSGLAIMGSGAANSREAVKRWLSANGLL